ncbi:[acyl-carrier-protein] S-malonyltransferase [Gracilibacillus orientalis]|uniref:Malonyl CoA-acyl carrier protein transacylase n=1 Tax=Gracilibacillus orientalis TaxID=334253 RepID=A0A1I4M4L1_9BACI|nr:ACP S-malonyltransferase [Gracilibacillus orientalis]SFL98066.1 [acyl-carrier-protein] S-malonyltransferase [Gracilibacillus orientalis]
MKKVAFVYPGQGSQVVEMGKDLYEEYQQVRELFDTANERLGYDLTSIMFEGPKDELTKTENTQPALLSVSTAITKILEENGITPSVTSGHSLGEYSALVTANAVSFSDAVSLVHQRGKLMESAYPEGKGSMAAVLGMDQVTLSKELQNISEQVDDIIEIANLNCPGQIVISGAKSAIDTAVDQLKSAGAKRVLPLPVSGPFHSSLMKPAAEEFQQLVHNINWSDAEIPVYANVTAEKVIEKEQIKQLLVEQLYSPVRFEEIIEQLLDESLDAIVEVGSGKVLTGLVKKINRRAKTFTVQDATTLTEFMEWMKED